MSKGESPSEEGRSERDSSCGWVDLLGLTHVFALVGGDDNVGVLDNTLEVLVHGLAIDLEFENTTIDFVNHHDWLDLLGKSLSKHSLGLHTDTFDVIDDDESSICDTEGSGNFRGEINVPWGINQVDQVWDDISLVDDVSLEVE